MLSLIRDVYDRACLLTSDQKALPWSRMSLALLSVLGSSIYFIMPSKHVLFGRRGGLWHAPDLLLVWQSCLCVAVNQCDLRDAVSV